jgi:hypothetical protein
VLSVRIICTNQEATLQVNPPTGAFLLLLRVAPSVSPPGNYLEGFSMAKISGFLCVSKRALFETNYSATLSFFPYG